MARKVPEWIGKTPDSMPSAKVRQRIYDREKATCYLCKGEIQPGQGFDLDHKDALIDGGENRESNLFPTHPKCHKVKTAQEAIERAPIERKRQKHTGAKRKKQPIRSRPFEKAPKPQKLPMPPRSRPLYERAE